MTAAGVVAGVLLLSGGFFLIVGGIGFARLPDVFSRLHVTGILDTLGGPLILLGAAVYLGPALVSLKLVLAIVFISVTGPLVAHLLARAAVQGGHEAASGSESAELVGQIRRRNSEARGP